MSCLFVATFAEKKMLQIFVLYIDQTTINLN